MLVGRPRWVRRAIRCMQLQQMHAAVQMQACTGCMRMRARRPWRRPSAHQPGGISMLVGEGAAAAGDGARSPAPADAAAGAAVSSGGITRSALPAGDACVEEV